MNQIINKLQRIQEMLQAFAGWGHVVEGADLAAVDLAIDRIIDATDSKIRWVKGYRERLRPTVANVLRYIDATVDMIPGSVRISKRQFALDPQVHAYFGSSSDIDRTLAHSSEVREFVDAHVGALDEHFSSLLCMQAQEKTVLGVELKGEHLRRDVRQTVVNFSDHHLLSPAANESQAREGLKDCLLDGLIDFAMQKINDPKERHAYLSSQKQRLAHRLKALRTDPAHTDLGELTKIEGMLAEVEMERRDTVQLNTPEDRLNLVCCVFSHPQDYMSVRLKSIRLSRMGVKLEDEDSAEATSGDEITFAEVMVGVQPSRVVVLAEFEIDDVPPKPDLVKAASSMMLL